MEPRLYALQIRPQAIIALSLDGRRQETILDGLGGIPDGIVVDLRSQTIFWTNMGQHRRTADGEDDFSAADGSIECCALDGSDRRMLVGGGTVVTPKQMVLDREAGRLYWCDREGMRVMRCGIDGSDVETLATTGLYPSDIGDCDRHCVGIALDERDGRIYWTQKGPADGGRGRLFRAGMEIPTGETHDARSDVELLADSLPEPIDLEIDEVGRILYWTDRGHLAGGNSLNRCSLDAGGPRALEIVAEGLAEGIGLALDCENGRAFVSDLSGAVRTTRLETGSTFQTVATMGPLTGIALPKVVLTDLSRR